MFQLKPRAPTRLQNGVRVQFLDKKIPLGFHTPRTPTSSQPHPSKAHTSRPAFPSHFKFTSASATKPPPFTQHLLSPFSFFAPFCGHPSVSPLFPHSLKNILHPRPASHTLHAVPSSLNLVNTWCCSRQDCRSFPGPRADETRLRTRCVAVIPAESHRGKAAPPYIPPNHTARKTAVIVMAAPVRCIPTDIALHYGRPQ